MEYSFTRYLRAKVSVDDRALNQAVWDRMKGLLPTQAPRSPLRVLEIGCGIGTMVERMVLKGIFSHVEYTGIDMHSDQIVMATQQLKEWSRPAGFQLVERSDGGFLLVNEDRELTLLFREAELHSFLDGEKDFGGLDFLVAHAFLDLVDVPAVLPRLLRTLRKGGVFYFTLNFDGKTIFEPQVDPDLDEQIERLYHLTMDNRVLGDKFSGDCQTGRHLFRYLREAGATILAVGASDWIVYPGEDGYPGDEAYFLHYIIHTIQGALQEISSLDEQRLLEWTWLRHAQVESGKLVYIAHQIDFVGKV